MLAYDTITGDPARNQTWRYSISFTPQTTGDDLTVTFDLSDVSNTNKPDFGISAAAVSVIPEPGLFGLLAGCLALSLVMVRRHRRA